VCHYAVALQHLVRLVLFASLRVAPVVQPAAMFALVLEAATAVALAAQ
jgi:hypothetical protein